MDTTGCEAKQQPMGGRVGYILGQSKNISSMVERIEIRLFGSKNSADTCEKAARPEEPPLSDTIDMIERELERVEKRLDFLLCKL